jgi:hypothetical protein
VSSPIFMYCAPGLVWVCTEVVWSHLHILRSRTRFRRYRRRGASFSCSTLSESIGAVPRAASPVFKFWAPRHIFCGIEGVVSHFHVLHFWTHFWQNRGCRVPYSCFALPFPFWAVPRVSGPVFMLCAARFVWGGTELVRSCFYVLRCRNYFRRYRGRRVPFLCFALSHSFSTVPRTLGIDCMFCALGLIFGGPTASGPVFKFCAPRLFFDGTNGIGSRFLFFSSELIFGGTEGVRSCFHVLRSRTFFGRFRGRGVPFSWFALSKSFGDVPRAVGPVFKFCAPGHVLGGTEGVGSCLLGFGMPKSR